MCTFPPQKTEVSASVFLRLLSVILLCLPVHARDRGIPSPQRSGSSQHADIFTSPMWAKLKEADELAAQGNWRECEKILFFLLQSAPHNTLLLEKTAHVLMVQNKWSEAHEQWNLLFQRDGRRYDVLTQMGRCLLMSNRPRDAENTLLLAHRLTGANPDARYYLAVAQIIQQAGETYRTTLGLVDVKETTRLLYLHAADTQKLRLGMTTPKYVAIADHLLNGGRSVQGSSLGNFVGEDLPVHLMGMQRLFVQLEAAMVAGQRDRARKMLAELANNRIQGPMLDAYRAYLDGLEGKGEESRILFKRVMEETPQWARPAQLFGIMLVETGAFDEAVPILRKAAALGDNRPFVVLPLIAALTGAGHNDEAWGLLEGLAIRHPAETLQALRVNAPAMKPLRERPQFSDLMERLLATAGDRMIGLE